MKNNQNRTQNTRAGGILDFDSLESLDDVLEHGRGEYTSFGQEKYLVQGNTGISEDEEDSDEILHPQASQVGRTSNCPALDSPRYLQACDEPWKNHGRLGPSASLDAADWVLLCRPPLSPLPTLRVHCYHYTVHRLTIFH